MPRYKLRTLLVLLVVLPPILAWWGWPAMQRLWQPSPQMLDVDDPFAAPPAPPFGRPNVSSADDPFAPSNGRGTQEIDPFAAP
jgi:hypothetical protein